MRENIVLEAGKVHFATRWQKLKSCLGQVPAALASEHIVEALFQGVQVEDIRGGIGLLLLA